MGIRWITVKTLQVLAVKIKAIKNQMFCVGGGCNVVYTLAINGELGKTTELTTV